MLYEIKWKKNGQIYTEIKDTNGTKMLLDWFETVADEGFEIISITIAE